MSVCLSVQFNLSTAYDIEDLFRLSSVFEGLMSWRACIGENVEKPGRGDNI